MQYELKYIISVCIVDRLHLIYLINYLIFNYHLFNYALLLNCCVPPLLSTPMPMPCGVS